MLQTTSGRELVSLQCSTSMWLAVFSLCPNRWTNIANCPLGWNIWLDWWKLCNALCCLTSDHGISCSILNETHFIFLLSEWEQELKRRKENTNVLSLTIPNFSANGALTMLSHNVVTNLESFSFVEMITKLIKEFKTTSRSFSSVTEW